ncbi:MAG: hypothetical protein JW969_00410 [Spirochaetales bacterium]|nr:hypothetical protein [Spirochaetales bacterium]
MKKLLILALLLILPIMAFADFQIGPTAMYNMLITAPPAVQDADRSFGLEDFTFGLDSRLNIGMFQGSAYALFTPGKFDSSTLEMVPHVIDIKLDVGLCLDIAILRLGLGIGPNFMIQLPPDASVTNVDPVAMGLNLKAAADLNLGSIAISLVYFTNTNLTADAVAASLSKWDGKLGLSLLFKLF